jgi:GDPmannose 4,6-dehydratase
MTVAKRAIVTGSRGQDGSYLVDQLTAQGAVVFGIHRDGVDVWEPDRHHEEGPVDLLDRASVREIVNRAAPDRVFHFAALSVVEWNDRAAIDAHRQSTRLLLDALADMPDPGHMVLAGSCLMFGEATEARQTEQTPFRPLSDYARAKVAAHDEIVRARQAGQFACTAILYNHESPRRPAHFVTRKISQTVARIARGTERELLLGPLDARRDWGYAPEYVNAMDRMLDADTPRDVILASGTTHAVGDLVKAAFDVVGKPWEDFVKLDDTWERRESRQPLCGDASLALEHLGWRAETSPQAIIREMVEHDLAELDGGGAA